MFVTLTEPCQAAFTRGGTKSLFCKLQVSIESRHVPSQERQFQVELQVLNFKIQVLNKSLVLFAQISVSVLFTISNLYQECRWNMFDIAGALSKTTQVQFRDLTNFQSPATAMVHTPGIYNPHG